MDPESEKIVASGGTDSIADGVVVVGEMVAADTAGSVLARVVGGCAVDGVGAVCAVDSGDVNGGGAVCSTEGRLPAPASVDVVDVFDSCCCCFGAGETASDDESSMLAS
jgi:hypothetical protein